MRTGARMLWNLGLQFNSLGQRLRLNTLLLSFQKAKNLMRQFSNTSAIGSDSSEMDSTPGRYEMCTPFEMPHFPIEQKQHREILEDKIYKK